MKKLNLLFMLALPIMLVFQSSFGQQPEQFSDAYNELLKQRAMYNYPTEKWDSLRCVWYGECYPILKSVEGQKSTCPLTKRMFGWHSIGVSSSGYVWQSMSDLSYFSYDVNPSTGNAINSSQISNWANDAVVITAKNNGVKVNLCATLFNSGNGEFSTFFGSSSAQSTLITNLVNAVIAANANGINIDFEGSSLSTTYLNQFVSFMSSLSTQLHNSVPNSELSVDLMGSQSGATSMINQLNPFVDLFIMMGYDYYYDGGSTAGPVAPTYSFGGGNVSNDVNNFLKIVAVEKFILGIPYYGRTWPTGQSNCTIPLSSTGTGNTFTYTLYKNNSSGYFNTLHRDAATFNPYFCYLYQSTTWKQAFIDDIYCYQKKYDLIKQRDIAGVAVWRLGFDAGYSDLWNLVNDNLSTCPNLLCTDTIYDMGGPSGNYHNNEDYTFTIEPPNATSVTLTFLSFDIESGYDYLKIYNGTSTSTTPIATLDGNTIPSPITATSGKMTIQFHSDGATNKVGYKAVYTCSTGGGGQPDLTVVNQSVSISTVPAGSSLTAYCAENNSGTATAAANTVMLYLSSDAVLTPGNNGDIYLGYINFSTLASGISSNINLNSIQIPNGTASGNYYLFFWADGSQVVTESNDANNFATVQIAVTGSTQTYSINTSSSPSVGGITSGSGTYSSGQNATVNATPNSGYSFINWSENSNPITTNPSYIFNVSSNRNLVANFSSCTYTLNYYSTSVIAAASSNAFWVNTASNCNWTATTSGCSGMITLTNASGTGNGMVTFDISANYSASPRSCTITVQGNTFTVNQVGYVAPCSTPPANASNCSATINGSNSISVSWWSGGWANLTEYQVERALSASGPFSTIAFITDSSTYYPDNSVIAGVTYYYRVRACCNSNCSNYTNVASVQACVYSTASTGIIVSNSNPCAGDRISLTVQGGSLGTNASWVWRTTQCHTGPIIGTGNTISIVPVNNTAYLVLAENGCSYASTYCSYIIASVNQPPTASIISANGATTFCEGNNVTLSGNSGGTWSNGAATSTITVSSSGDYFVTNTNSCGSVTSNHILVNANQAPYANSGANASICEGNSNQIGSSSVSGYTYSWFPANGLSNSSISNPIASPLSTTTYMLTVTNSISGCTATDSSTIYVNPIPQIPTITQNGNTLMSSSTTGNQWYLNGDMLIGATSQFYTTSVSSFYQVIVTNNYGCFSQSAIFNFTTKIEENKISNKIEIFPNPSNYVINIVGSDIDNGTYKFTLRNIIGQSVLFDDTKIINNKIQKQLSILNLSNGLYFLSIESEKSQIIVKVEKVN